MTRPRLTPTERAEQDAWEAECAALTPPPVPASFEGLRSACCGQPTWGCFGEEWDRMCSWCGARRSVGWLRPGAPGCRRALREMRARVKPRFKRLSRRLWAARVEYDAAVLLAARAVSLDEAA